MFGADFEVTPGNDSTDESYLVPRRTLVPVVPFYPLRLLGTTSGSWLSEIRGGGVRFVAGVVLFVEAPPSPPVLVVILSRGYQTSHNQPGC